MYLEYWEEKNRRHLVELHRILIYNIKVDFPYDLFVETIYNSKSKGATTSYRKKKLNVLGPVCHGY
jgi:hypothetical protein